MDWIGWRPLTYSAGRKGAAVYQLRVLSQGTPASVPRLLAVDRGGLLFIGETGGMERRLRQLRRGIEKGKGHSEGGLLHCVLCHTRFREVFSDYSLEYRYTEQSDKAAAGLLEARMIKDYVRKFGDPPPPPLNSAIPDRGGEWGARVPAA